MCNAREWNKHVIYAEKIQYFDYAVSPANEKMYDERLFLSGKYCR